MILLPLLVVMGFIALVLLAVVALYNRLVRLRVAVNTAWSQIDVQFKRRHDLIPNLVETVKGYAGHERATLERVVQARQQAVSAQGVREQTQAENVLTGALRQLFALAESYPNLKANENFLQLQQELSRTENAVGVSRQEYNAAVADYNAGIQTFPAVLLAGMFGFLPREFFELTDPAERAVPKVQF